MLTVASFDTILLWKPFIFTYRLDGDVDYDGAWEDHHWRKCFLELHLENNLSMYNQAKW